MAATDLKGLDDAQLLHFSEKGWVLRPDVFTKEECSKLRAAGDRLVATGTHSGVETSDAADTDGMHHGRITVEHVVDSAEDVFHDWIMHPAILPALKQLLGAPPQFTGGVLMITPPHPRRGDATVRATLRDPEGSGHSLRRHPSPTFDQFIDVRC
jgi:hypothetical protein